ncbi:MAG: hypothetical protein AB7R55_12025 [Gemmatimonadales bacterium]
MANGGWKGGLVMGLAVIGLAAAISPERALNEGVAGEATSPADAWLDRLDGKYQQLFDAPAPNGGVPLVHMLNYYDTYNQAYGVEDSEVDGILTFYGTTTFFGLNDAMWAKYRLGAFLELDDPTTGEPAVVNPWRVEPEVIGMKLPQASIESLQQRGATFLLCNNALGVFANMVARQQGLDGAEVYEDMKANVLPGVTLVPAMVIAIQKAQARGIAYHRQ